MSSAENFTQTGKVKICLWLKKYYSPCRYLAIFRLTARRGEGVMTKTSLELGALNINL